ncbi:MAG: hypothetical protein ABIE14_02085 [Patescibacteria group bacterium]
MIKKLLLRHPSFLKEGKGCCCGFGNKLKKFCESAAADEAKEAEFAPKKIR